MAPQLQSALCKKLLRFGHEAHHMVSRFHIVAPERNVFFALAVLSALLNQVIELLFGEAPGTRVLCPDGVKLSDCL